MGNKLLALLLSFCFTLVISFFTAQENAAPKVKIISPSEDTRLAWNTLVPFRITIVDQEDGNSEYNEIDVNEVVLTVTYIDDSSQVRKYVEKVVESRSDLLSFMASSNCFSCHQSKDRGIGPSFEEIVNRYRPTHENKTYLAQKIGGGSKGVWGDEIMPAQPELEPERIMQMLEWIFANAKNSDYTFFTGTEGAFKTKKRPKDIQSQAVYVMHAQYKDHGIGNSPGKSKKGFQTVVLKIE